MGKMRLKNKGIFFTFIAITIMTLFVIVFTPQAEISVQKDMQATGARISSIDDYVDDLETRYFETVLRATTYKAILSLIYYMNSTGSFIPDIDSAFSEVMLKGTINNVPIDSITNKKIMDNNTLTNWSSRITEAAKDTLNVNTTIKITNVTVFQTKPWNIDSSLTINFTVQSNVAEWRKTSAITATISLEGLHDPYYLVNTNKAYTNRIKKSSVEFNQWNIAKTREHLRNGTYVYWQSPEAPSFLMRFTNTMTNSSCCGIESLVNPNMISPSDQRESYVDYLFWTHKFQNNCAQLYNITGLWDEFKYFKMDINHIVKYNITAQDAVKTC
ncbi:hypothetical protein J4480_00480 [Candidatus Woesearchaeota archaeon]|nr:hypothetical protein [Candidatus Woesearchaeota archaeon]